jgi:hypothetical protein
MEGSLVKHIVHISKHWNKPDIDVKVFVDGISIEMSLEDLVKAIAADMPHPAFAVTRSRTEASMLSVLESVLNKVKEASIHV